MTTRSWIRAELKKNFDKANRGAREAARAEPRAVEARYMPASRQLRVRLTNGASLSLPVSIIPELRNATPAQLAGIEILPGGDGLHWEALDFTISVTGLVASLFGRSVWMSELGRVGGAQPDAKEPACVVLRLHGAERGDDVGGARERRVYQPVMPQTNARHGERTHGRMVSLNRRAGCVR